MSNRVLGRATALVFVLGLLAFAPVAHSQTQPTQDTYAGEGAEVAAAVEPPEPVRADVRAEPSALPFSGLDIALLALGAVVLAGTGAGLARVTSRAGSGHDSTG